MNSENEATLKLFAREIVAEMVRSNGAQMLPATTAGVLQACGTLAPTNGCENLLYAPITTFRFYRGGRTDINVILEGLIPVVPGASVLVYLLASGQLARLRQVLGDAWSWAIFFGVATPWYAYALHRHGMAFIDGFILQHNVNRFLQAKEGHDGASYYTLVVAPLLVLPWTPLIVSVLGHLKSLWADPRSRFLLCWSGFALLFFSLSSTKLPHYLLYGLTPAMVLLAQTLTRARSVGMGVALAASQLVLFGVLSWSQQVAGWLAERTADPLYKTLLSTAEPGPPWWQLAAVGCVWVAAWLWPGWRLAQRAAAGALIGAFWTVLVVLPWWAQTLQSPIKELALIARERGVPVTQWHTRQPSFGFYLGAATPPGEPPAGGLALVRIDRIPPGAEVGIVAEGVETEEQIIFLRGENCTELQGYAIGRPAPVDALDAWTMAIAGPVEIVISQEGQAKRSA